MPHIHQLVTLAFANRNVWKILNVIIFHAPAVTNIFAIGQKM